MTVRTGEPTFLRLSCGCIILANIARTVQGRFEYLTVHNGDHNRTPGWDLQWHHHDLDKIHTSTTITNSEELETITTNLIELVQDGRLYIGISRHIDVAVRRAQTRSNRVLVNHPPKEPTSP